MKPESLLERVRVVLTRPSHPGNIGAAARAAKTMGVGALWLVAPKTFPDPQAESMASGATDLLAAARVCATLDEALAGCVSAVALTARRRELAAEPLWLRDAVAELVGAAEQGEVALVFGNETFGLSNDELALCPRWAMIPANPDYSSLNLGAAVQVACYETRLAALTPGTPPAVPDAGRRASLGEVDGLLAHLEKAALTSGFLDPAQPKRLMARLRRLFGRAQLEREEINILRGLIAALERKS